MIFKEQKENSTNIMMHRVASFLGKFGSIVSALLYVSVGVILIISTKYILTDLNFPFPIFISSVGQLFTSILVHILVQFKCVTLRREISNRVDLRFLIVRIGSIGFFATLALVLGNYAYLYISVPLIQILKSFTPVVTMLLSFLILKLPVTIKLTLAISILTLGTLITTADIWSTNNNININIFGVFIMLCSSLSEALKVVLTHYLLKGAYTQNKSASNIENDSRDSLERELLITSNDNNTDKKNNIVVNLVEQQNQDIKLTVHESMYYYAPISFMFMVILAVFVEFEEFINGYDQYTQIIMDNIFLFATVSVLGYGVMISSFFVTKYFSGLYLKALSVFRNFILVLTVVYFGEVMTRNQVIGYGVSIIGFIFYNFIRLQKK